MVYPTNYELIELWKIFAGDRHSSSALLTNCVGDLGRKYDNYVIYLLILVNVYAKMIIEVIRGCWSSKSSLSIRKKKKIKIRSYELLNSQESNNTLLANCIEDLGRRYDSYLSYSLVSASVYASIIIGVIRKVLFLWIFSLNQNFIRKKMKNTPNSIIIERELFKLSLWTRDSLKLKI